jgi:hypothetical protein
MKTHVYIVRVWSEPNPGGSSVQRVSVMDATSRERWYFPSADRLIAFLLESADREISPVHSR